LRSSISTDPDIRRPRTVGEIFLTTLALIGRRPLLFVGLAALVVVPYDLIVLLIAHASPLGQDRTSAETALLLELIAIVIVAPFVSALYVNALSAVDRAEPTRIDRVLVRSLRALPVVIAAEIIAGIGIGFGLVLFIVPGVYLLLRWAVVAQVAGIEQTNWPGALRRAAELARGNYWRILGLYLLVSLVTLTLSNVAEAAIGGGTHPAQAIVGFVIDIITEAFRALAFALLYFDLLARHRELPPVADRP
jgi:hypothetical protein